MFPDSKEFGINVRKWPRSKYKRHSEWLFVLIKILIHSFIGTQENMHKYIELLIFYSIFKHYAVSRLIKRRKR